MHIGDKKTICSQDSIAILAHSNYPIKVARKLKDCLVVRLLVNAQNP
jgi:hypothetical protein